jgi:hypothetical protein
VIRQLHTFKKSTRQIQIHMADRSVGEMVKNVGFGKFQEIAKKKQKVQTEHPSCFFCHGFYYLRLLHVVYWNSKVFVYRGLVGIEV